MDELTIQEVAQIVASEGLGYAVGEYLNSDSIQDADLRELWENAQVSLNELDVFLTPHYEEV